MKHDSELFRLLLDSLPCPIFWKGLDLRYLGCNTAFARMAGLEPQQVVGLDDYQLPWSREESDFYRLTDERVMRSGQSLADFDETVRLVGGQQSWAQTTKVPLRDARGEIIGVLGVLIDITARHEAQKQLRIALAAGEAANRMLQAQAADREAMQRALALSELRLRSAVRGAPISISSMDLQGVLTFSDGGALSSLGLKPGQNVGRSVFEISGGSS